MTFSPDQTILNGKYRILRLAGEGGAARVWLAEEPLFGGRRVALKELRRELLSAADLVEQGRRFRQEVYLATMLEQAHVPNVIRAYTVEELPDGSLLLVMEYAAGGSLAGLIAAHPHGLPLDQAVRIAAQIAEALAGLHRLDSAPVHRDVKPSNILLTDTGDVRLADFGLAQLSGVSGRSLVENRPHPGTPLYMAPEQAHGGGYLTPAADIFALGCVLFEMLTGQRYTRLAPATAASSLRPDLPQWLDTVLACALALEPWRRWQEAGALAGALLSGATNNPVHHQSAPAPRTEKQTPIPEVTPLTGGSGRTETPQQLRPVSGLTGVGAGPQGTLPISRRWQGPRIRLEERPPTASVISPTILFAGLMVLVGIIVLVLVGLNMILTR